MADGASLINRDELLGRCLNDPDFMQQLLHVFRDSTPGLVAKLRSAVEARNYDQVRQHAHTLKGSAANMAIAALRDLAFNAEEAAKAQQPEALDQLLARIDATTTAALAEIKG